MIYLFILLLLLILSFRYDIRGKERGRDECYIIVLIIFILVSGLRYRIGTDTVTYLYRFYHEYPALEDFSLEDWYVGKDPLFVLLNSLVFSLGGKFYMVQLVHAAIVNGLVFKYIRRHSPYIFTCIFFYAIMEYLYYNTQVMRGSMSIVICLYANDYFLRRKWIKGYSLLFIALMFHAQTLVMFVMPFLFFLRFNKKGIVVLVAAFFLGQIAGMLLNDYASLLMTDDNTSIGDKALSYANSEKYSAQMVLKGALLTIGSRFAYLFFTLGYLKRHDKSNEILRLEPLMMLFCFFMMIQSGFFIAYRYVAYYVVYVVIIYAYGFVTLAKSIRFTQGLSYARAFILFFPIVFFIIRAKVVKEEERVKYLPYSSVIEKNIDPDRERLYNYLGRPHANFNEY